MNFLEERELRKIVRHEIKTKVKPTDEFLTMGLVFAAVISWDINHHFGWMLWHYICGWFYVIYWALGYAGGGQ